MKNLFVIPVICSFLFACNNSPSNNIQDTSVSIESDNNHEKLNNIIDSLSSVIETNSINLKSLLSSNIKISKGEFIRSDGYDDDWWYKFKINNQTKKIYAYVDEEDKDFEILNNIPHIYENEWPEKDENGNCRGSCYGTIVYIDIEYEIYNQATEKSQLRSDPFLIYFIPD